MEIELSWTDFKSALTTKNLAAQYTEDAKFYYVFASENGNTYKCVIYKDSPADTDQNDFETNYKPNANSPIHPSSPDRKEKVVSSSIPLNTMTWFTTCGDKTTPGQEEIGSMEHRIAWDFSNTDNDDPSPPAGTKRKIIEFEFLDNIYVKEGTIYFHDALKNSYVDLFVVCKDGKYYLNNAGAPTLAVGDTKVYHYVVAHPICGSVPMGDELNTEQAMEQAVTTDFKFCIVITVPNTDVLSHGVIELECYRSRTIIL